MSDPYRDIAIVPAHRVAPWVIHGHSNRVSAGGNECCRWCGQVSTVARKPRCFGRKRWWLFGRFTCPTTPHHHVICWNGLRGCRRDWLEVTCDEAIAEDSNALSGTITFGENGSAVVTGNTPIETARKMLDQ
jgi:hypothetical protein